MLLKLKYLDELGEQTSWKLTRHSDQAVDCGVSSNRKRGTAEFNVCRGPQPNSGLKITIHSFELLQFRILKVGGHLHHKVECFAWKMFGETSIFRCKQFPVVQIAFN